MIRNKLKVVLVYLLLSPLGLHYSCIDDVTVNQENIGVLIDTIGTIKWNYYESPGSELSEVYVLDSLNV